MDPHWYFMALIWATAEGIGYFRKKEFRVRVKSGAKWSFAISSLSLYGGVYGSSNSTIYLLVAILMSAAIVAPIYFFRIKAFSFVSKKYQNAASGNLEYERNTSRGVFHLYNLFSQLLSIAAGLFIGITLTSFSALILALT